MKENSVKGRKFGKKLDQLKEIGQKEENSVKTR